MAAIAVTLLVVSLAGIVAGIVIKAYLIWKALFSGAVGDEPAASGKWEVVPAVDAGEVVGYLVRWSIPDDRRRYLWVGHYYAGPELSLGWCQNAAESDAKRKNRQGKLPSDYGAYGIAE